MNNDRQVLYKYYIVKAYILGKNNRFKIAGVSVILKAKVISCDAEVIVLN